MAKKHIVTSDPLFEVDKYSSGISNEIGDIERSPQIDPYWDELFLESEVNPQIVLELDRLIPANTKIGVFIVQKADNFLSLGIIINTKESGFFVDWLNFGESSENVNFLCGSNCFYNWERSEWSINKLAIAPQSLIDKFLDLNPDFSLKNEDRGFNVGDSDNEIISLKNEDGGLKIGDGLRLTIGDRIIDLKNPTRKGKIVEIPSEDYFVVKWDEYEGNSIYYPEFIAIDNQGYQVRFGNLKPSLIIVGNIYLHSSGKRLKVQKVLKGRASGFVEGFFEGDPILERIAISDLAEITKENQSCSHTPHSLPESEGLNSELKPQEQGELLAPESSLKTTQKPNESLVIDFQELGNIQTLETGNQNQENITSTQLDSLAQVQALLVTDQDLNTQNQVCGSMPYERSPKEDLISLLLKTPQDLSTTDLEQFLEDSEWSSISGTIRKSYQLRNSAHPTKENGFSSLPTPTTYPKGSTGCRPAGTNRLEQKLRPYIQKGDKLHPAVSGWMMGFPIGWVEQVLADTGELLSVQPPLIPVQATTSTTAATVSICMDGQLHPNKPALPLNELSILPNSPELLTTTNTDNQTTTQEITEQGEVSTILTTPTTQVERGQGVENRGEASTSTITKIKAVTLHQPWAYLVGIYKWFETRGKATNYRGKIAIHAAVEQKDTFYQHNLLADLLPPYEELVFGAVVAIADLTDCIKMTEEFISQQSETELRCGLWEVGRYAWKLENVVFLPEPIPARGMPGLWDIELPIISSQEAEGRRQEGEEAGERGAGSRGENIFTNAQCPMTHAQLPNFKTGEYVLNGRVGEIIEDSPGEYFVVKYSLTDPNDLRCYFFGQDDELISQLVIAPPDLREQFLKDNLVTELCRSAEPLIEPEVSLKKKIASGSLAPYLEHKKLKDGRIVSYPKVEGERDKFNHLHWRWGYYYEVKVDGEWRNRSLPTPARIVPQVKILIENRCSVEEIKAFILQAKNKKAGVVDS